MLPDDRSKNQLVIIQLYIRMVVDLGYGGQSEVRHFEPSGVRDTTSLLWLSLSPAAVAAAGFGGRGPSKGSGRSPRWAPGESVALHWYRRVSSRLEVRRKAVTNPD